MTFERKLPTFTRCADGKFYQDLVYQDSPLRRAWFICFSDTEPAEIVVRISEQGDMDARTILNARGFSSCLKGIMPGRKEKHHRFFGFERNVVTGEETPVDGHAAISWFLILKKGVPLPTPSGHDSCVEIYPFFPNKEGIYFGDKR
jgi:hypothetical protein